jgi:hypothetical protein
MDEKKGFAHFARRTPAASAQPGIRRYGDDNSYRSYGHVLVWFLMLFYVFVTYDVYLFVSDPDGVYARVFAPYHIHLALVSAAMPGLAFVFTAVHYIYYGLLRE